MVELSNLTNRTKLVYRSHLRPGFSYVEVLLASVIISILLVSGLRLFGNLGRSQQSTTGKEYAGTLITSLLSEIEKQNYRDPEATDDTLGRETEESDTSRSNYDDVDDYDGWTANPPEDQLEQPYSQFSHLTRSVTVRYVMSDDFTQSAATDEGFKEVTITVSRSPGGEMVQERIFVLANYKAQ